MITVGASQLLQWLLLSQCLLLSAFVYKRAMLWPLAALLTNLALQMLWDIALTHGWSPAVDLRALMAFAYGPLLLALVRHLAWVDRPATRWLHALPSLIASVLVNLWPDSQSHLGLLASVSLGIYLVLAFVELARFERVLRQTRSRYEEHSLSWLRETLLGLAAVGAIDLCRQLLTPYMPAADEPLTIATYAAAAALVYFLSWRAMQQRIGFAGLEHADEDALPDHAAAAEPPVDDRVAQLQAHMDVHRPYLDPDLSVRGLALQLSWPVKQLSTLINQRLGKNFNDWVNAYRVQAACALLAQPERRNDKLLAIQLDAGFASKSVFNAAFKRHTGQTPSLFRQRLDSGPS